MVDSVFTVYFTSRDIDKFLQSGICLGVAIESAGAGVLQLFQQEEHLQL